MLNLLRRISCFMSSLEKPYVVDNSALTGREAAPASHIPSVSSAGRAQAPRSPRLGVRKRLRPPCGAGQHASACASCAAPDVG